MRMEYRIEFVHISRCTARGCGGAVGPGRDKVLVPEQFLHHGATFCSAASRGLLQEKKTLDITTM